MREKREPMRYEEVICALSSIIAFVFHIDFYKTFSGVFFVMAVLFVLFRKKEGESKLRQACAITALTLLMYAIASVLTKHNF
jgi:hypothetical protein